MKRIPERGKGKNISKTLRKDDCGTWHTDRFGTNQLQIQLEHILEW